MKILLISVLLAASSIFACGPLFSDKIMQERSSTLRYLPKMRFEADLRYLFEYVANTGTFRYDTVSAYSEEFLWVDKKQIPSLIAARSANSEFDLQKALQPLPQNLATYLYASYLFNHTKLMRTLRRNSSTEQSLRMDPHQTYRALILYNTLIAMDNSNKQPITVRAMFMKGRCFQRLLMRDSAEVCFKKVEQMGKDGVPDRLNLAWESIGEQGAIAFQRKNHINALELYIAQIVALGPIKPNQWRADKTVTDSDKNNYTKQRFSSVAGSIVLTLDEIFQSDSIVEIACKQPAMEFLIASYLYNSFPAFDSRTLADDDSSKTLRIKRNKQYCKIIENAPIQSTRAADRFAAAAYRFEQYDLANKLTKNSGSGLGWWIRAKLAIQKKDMNRASYCYAQALKHFKSDRYHDITTWKGNGGSNLPQFDDKDQYIRPLVESAVLSVVRGDFTAALSTLYSTNNTETSWLSYWDDIAYVAERLVTTDQLMNFVDSVTTPTPPIRKEYEGRPDIDIRLLLGRRLMREQRYSEAIQYFHNNPWYADSTMPSLQQLAKQFITFSKSVRTSSGISKAEQLFSLSQITRKWGMELTGTELDPDWTLHGGSHSEGDYEYLTDSSKIDRIDSSYGYNDTIYRQIPVSRYRFEPGFATAEEYRRLKATQVIPYRRYHYRWIASDLALEAAHLVPPKSQAFVAILTKSFWYIATHDSIGSKKIYNYYRRSKPVYNFDPYKTPDWKAARKMAEK